MVDNFAIALSHLLIALTIWRLLPRHDLDTEPPPPAEEGDGGFLMPGRAGRSGGTGVSHQPASRQPGGAHDA